MSELVGSGGGDVGGAGLWPRSTSFVGSGGMGANGQGTWSWEPGTKCHLVIADNGLVQLLDKVRLFQSGWWAAGLFQNDHKPKRNDLIGAYVPASFSGYSGPQLIYFNTAPVMVGETARTSGPPLLWTHDGGPLSNFVYGFYVVDRAGAFTYGERFCAGPVEMARKGRTLQLEPSFLARNLSP